MSGTKPRNKKDIDPTSRTGKVKSIATQTSNIDSYLEIAKLQEQLKLLQLENNILRQHMQTPEKFDSTTRHTLSPFKTQREIPKNNSKKYCGCKGNCSSKICGCVKKNNRCTLSCKCNETCQNQKLRETKAPEDKENINENNVRVKTVKKQVKVTSYSMIQETKSDYAADDDVKSGNTKAQFDPMKPRHQLSRTPPNMRKADEIVDKLLSNQFNDTVVTSLNYKSPQQMKINSLTEKKIVEPEINWEQHTAQLIPCKKCNRTFMPHRVQKHEACCKKV